MKQLLLITIISIQITFAQNKPDVKTEAVDAFKEIVKTYYDNDCKKYYDFFDDSVSTLNKDSNWRYPSYKLIGKKKSDCTNFAQGAIKETKTYAYYLINYDIQAVSYDEFKHGDRISLLKKWDTIKHSNGGWDLMFITIFNKYYQPNDVLVI